MFADGTELSFPTDRGEQFAVHEQRYGTATAERWRDSLDWLDDVWQTVRPLGLEAELTDRAQLTGPVRRRIRQERTIADLADGSPSPHLARGDARRRLPPGRRTRDHPGLVRGAAVRRAPLRAVDADSRTASTTTGHGPGGPRR